MDIKLELGNNLGYDGKRSYLDIKDAYKNGIEYVKVCNKEGKKHAIARVLIYMDENNSGQHLVGEIFISSRKRYPNGYDISCKDAYDVQFVDFWANLKETRSKVNELFDEVR